MVEKRWINVGDIICTEEVKMAVAYGYETRCMYLREKHKREAVRSIHMLQLHFAAVLSSDSMAL